MLPEASSHPICHPGPRCFRPRIRRCRFGEIELAAAGSTIGGHIFQDRDGAPRTVSRTGSNLIPNSTPLCT